MKQRLSVAGAVLLIAWPVHSALAQAQARALTNADVVHLVAMRVSDQTVIAVVQEAVTAQFDLSPQAAIELAGHGVPVAVIGAMRHVSARATPPANGTASEPPVGGQTLAGAAAEAAAAAQTRSLTVSLALELPAPAVSAAAPSDAAPASVPDEASWRARIAPLHLSLRDNRAKEGPLLNRINSLTVESHLLGLSGVKRRVVETEKQRVTAELADLRESLRANMAAIQALEEEGRRAGVPPAWLR